MTDTKDEFSVEKVVSTRTIRHPKRGFYEKPVSSYAVQHNGVRVAAYRLKREALADIQGRREQLASIRIRAAYNAGSGSQS